MSASKSNDVHGAALAIAVLNFMRPNLIRKDGLKYDQTVNKILGDYFPRGSGHMEESAVFGEARRLRGILSRSGALIRALSKQRTVSE
jgi:hypothetical protein